jgi:N utilization substance protein A
MRGSRIKNIVRELENEKLDIIKWEPDIATYIVNALSPAKVESVIVNEKEKKLEVRVAEDQLSVAIGKKGQNVRLASRLTGWDIDVRKVGEEVVPSEVTAPAPGPVETPQEVVPPQEASLLASKLEISQKKADALVKAGLDSLEKIANAPMPQLLALKGFGEKTATKIKEKALNLIKKSE